MWSLIATSALFEIRESVKVSRSLRQANFIKVDQKKAYFVPFLMKSLNFENFIKNFSQKTSIN